MKLIIAGSRTITDYQVLREAIKKIEENITEIVSGGAEGVDRLGEKYAKENDLPLRKFPAFWDIHGKAAGPIRNWQMADYADVALVIWDGKSKGSQNMIKTMQELGKKVIIHEILDR